MLKETYRAVIFDLDDTLVDCIGPKWLQHKEAAKEFSGLELTDEDLRSVWGMPFKKMVKKLYRTDDFDGALRVIRSISDDYPKIPFPGTTEKLIELGSQGLVLGILTSMSKEGVDRDFTYLPYEEDWFFSVQTEDDTEFHKPDSRVFGPTLERLAEIGLTAADVVYIGDNVFDFQATTGAGIDFIGVATGLTSVSEFNRLGCWAIPSVAELELAI